MYNVEYDRGDGTKAHYLTSPVSKAAAKAWKKKFCNRYVGKAHPNGLGHYTVCDVRVVEV